MWISEAGDIGHFYEWQLKMCYAVEDIRNESLQYAKDEQDHQKRWEESQAKAKECKAEALAFHQKRFQELRASVRVLPAVDLGTIAIGWLLVWLITSVVRWIYRGFASA